MKRFCPVCNKKTRHKELKEGFFTQLTMSLITGFKVRHDHTRLQCCNCHQIRLVD